MTSVLIWVCDVQRDGDEFFLAGEPLMTTTGIANDDAKFVGSLIAVQVGAKSALGITQLTLRLGVNAEMSWRSNNKSVPTAPFLLTDQDTMQTLHDGPVRLTSVSELLRHRLAGSDWRYAGFKFGDFEGVIENDGGNLDTPRIVIFGDQGSILDSTLAMRDIDDSDEILASVELGARKGNRGRLSPGGGRLSPGSDSGFGIE